MKMFSQSARCFDDQIRFVDWYSRIIAMKDDLVVVTQIKDEIVTERNRLQERHDIVITIGSLT